MGGKIGMLRVRHVTARRRCDADGGRSDVEAAAVAIAGRGRQRSGGRRGGEGAWCACGVLHHWYELVDRGGAPASMALCSIIDAFSGSLRKAFSNHSPSNSSQTYYLLYFTISLQKIPPL